MYEQHTGEKATVKHAKEVDRASFTGQSSFLGLTAMSLGSHWDSKTSQYSKPCQFKYSIRMFCILLQHPDTAADIVHFIICLIFFAWCEKRHLAFKTHKSGLLVLFCTWTVWSFYFNVWQRKFQRYLLWLTVLHWQRSLVMYLIKYVFDVRKLDADIILFCIIFLCSSVNVLLE